MLGSLGVADVTDGDTGELRIVGMTAGTNEIVEAMVLNQVKVYEISKQGTDLEGYYLNMLGNGRES